MVSRMPPGTDHADTLPVAGRDALFGAWPPQKWVQPLISFQPGMDRLRRLLGRPVQDITAKAVDQWTVSRGSRVEIKPARVLPGQLDRIRGTEFGSIDEVIRDFSGGFDSIQGATTAYRLENITLMDGVLYSGDAARHLRKRNSRLPFRRKPKDEIRATMYESWTGNRWFGNWLAEDTLTYRLAESEGLPFTTNRTIGHMTAYEQRLDMTPTRMLEVRFADLIIFEDFAHNEHKRQRAIDFRRRMVGQHARRHPGVFVLRGQAGDRRVLTNEREIAERLEAKRGFTILDPLRVDVDEIVRVCGGADVVVGTEGSHLVHGLMLMPQDATALVIQPPARAVSVLKMFTDRQGQNYSLVVGEGSNEAFSADVGEIERTLDLA